MTNDQWATPTPLRPDGTNLLPFPVNALPPIIGDMAQAIATTTSTDVAMAGTSILSAVSYCFSGVYRMSAKRDHTEPLVLDTLTIAEPSFKKSPVMSLIKRPYIQFAHDWNENNKQDIFTSQAERKLLQSKLEALEKKKDVTAEEIARLQTELSNIPPSNFRRIAVDDVTPESLVNLLEENGTLLMISDEAGMLGNFSGRYSNNVPNLDLLLKSWNGETYISDRATRASIVLKKPYMSICLACQPYVFDGMINNPVFRGSGLIARFMYCFPVSNIGSRKYDTQAVPEQVAESYKNLVYKLLGAKFTYHDEKELYLHFDAKAYGEFVDYYNNFIEPHLVTDMAFCKDWGGKYHGELLRLCGIIHCIKCALNGVEPVENRVTLDTFCNAIEIGEYFREQAIYAEVAVACLKEYMEGFQKRNPNLYVFNAVMHLDEATPHLHINYIPVGHYDRGLDTRNAMAKALEEMNFGHDARAINRWRLKEWAVLSNICAEHGIEISEPQKSRGYSYTVEEYGKHQDEIKALNAEMAQVESELAEKQAKREDLDQQIEQKTAQVKAILNYIPDYEKEFKIEDECDQLRRELIGLLDGKLSIMKHKDAIIAKVQRLCKLVKKVNDNAHKSGNAIYSLHEKLDAAMKKYDDACQRWKCAAEERTELCRNNAALSAEVDDLTEFVSLLKRLEPQKYAEVRQAQEYVHSQREQEAQQQSTTRKKKSWGLE